MNRNKRREKEKHVNKFMKWINELSKDKQEFLDAMIRLQVEKIEDKYKGFKKDYERGLIGSLVDHTDMSIDEIQNIFNAANYLCEEYENNIKEIVEKGEDISMAINLQMEKMKEKLLFLMGIGKDKKECLEIMYSEFPKASKSIVNSAYINTKKDFMKASIDTKGQEFKEEKQLDNEHIKTVVEQKKKDEPKNKSKFEVLSTLSVVKGVYGNYTVSNTDINGAEGLFKSPANIEQWHKSELEDLKAQYLKDVEKANNIALEYQELLQEFKVNG